MNTIGYSYEFDEIDEILQYNSNIIYDNLERYNHRYSDMNICKKTEIIEPNKEIYRINNSTLPRKSNKREAIIYRDSPIHTISLYNDKWNNDWKRGDYSFLKLDEPIQIKKKSKFFKMISKFFKRK